MAAGGSSEGHTKHTDRLRSWNRDSVPQRPGLTPTRSSSDRPGPQAQARRASDECIYMLLGEIVEHGPTEEVFYSPRDKRTEAYVEGRYG